MSSPFSLRGGINRGVIGAGSGSDNSVGWISVTDSMLLGFGVMMCVAIASAASTTTAKTERDTLQQRLTVADAENLQNSRKLAGLSKDEKQHLEALDALEAQKAALDARIVDLERELTDATAALSTATDALARTEEESGSLSQSLQNAEEARKSAESQLELQRQATLDATDQLSQLLAAEDEEAEQRAERERELAETQEARKGLEEKLAESQLKLRSLQAQIDALRQEKDQLATDSLNRQKNEVGLRRDLVGFTGELKKVAFVVDGSASMGIDADRWPNAKRTVLSWIENLDVQECVVIVFTNRVHRFPQGEKDTFNLQGESRATSIEQIRNYLRQRTPVGFTNTLAALKTAYAMPGVDTIILFTDGAPYVGLSDQDIRNGKKDNSLKTSDNKHDYDPEMMQAIYDLCEDKKHAGIPINVVGVGDFYSAELSTFLLNLARITNGTFIGR